jgi:septal ring factor EnvC (AmiA/AmiB activator)
MTNANTTQTAAMITMTTVSTTRKSLSCGERVFEVGRLSAPVDAERPVTAHADRALLMLVLAAALLALLLTAGAAAVFVQSRRQDDHIAKLRREVAQLERANGALFAGLAQAAADKRESAARIADLEGRLRSERRQLDRANAGLATTKASLAAARRRLAVEVRRRASRSLR